MRCVSPIPKVSIPKLPIPQEHCDFRPISIERFVLAQYVLSLNGFLHSSAVSHSLHPIRISVLHLFVNCYSTVAYHVSGSKHTADRAALIAILQIVTSLLTCSHLFSPAAFVPGKATYNIQRVAKRNVLRFKVRKKLHPSVIGIYSLLHLFRNVIGFTSE